MKQVKNMMLLLLQVQALTTMSLAMNLHLYMASITSQQPLLFLLERLIWRQLEATLHVLCASHWVASQRLRILRQNLRLQLRRMVHTWRMVRLLSTRMA